jgi:hypothetical protein
MYIGLDFTTSDMAPGMDGTISCVSNVNQLRRGRRLPPTLEVKELEFVIGIIM